MKIFIAVLVVTSFLSTGASPSAAATDEGESLYIRYCSNCHGKDGRGGGPVAPYLKIKVPDLSLLKKNHKGIYPLDKVMASIDGRRSVAAHGDRQMPVWGEVFRKEAEKDKYPELTSLLKARTIAEYLAQLQH